MLALLAALLIAAPAEAAACAATHDQQRRDDRLGCRRPAHRAAVEPGRHQRRSARPLACSRALRLTDGRFLRSLLERHLRRRRPAPTAQRSTSPGTAAAFLLAWFATSEILAGRPLILALDARRQPRLRTRSSRSTSFVRTSNGDSEADRPHETSADSGRFAGFILTAVRRADRRRLPPLGPAGRPALTLDAQRRSRRHAAGEARSTSSPIRSASSSTAATARGGGRARHPDRRRHRPAGAGVRRRRHFGLSEQRRHRQSVTDGGGTRYNFRPASIASRWSGRAATGSWSSRRRPIPRPRRRLRPISRRCAAQTAGPSPSSRPPTAASSTLTGPARGADQHSARRAARRRSCWSRQASRADAEPGDPIHYRLTVRNPDARRDRAADDHRSHSSADALRTGSVRIDGDERSGSDLRCRSAAELHPRPRSRPANSRSLSYVLEVRPGAAAATRSTAPRRPARGAMSATSPTPWSASAATRIADRMTILGRVIDGGCCADPRTRPGIAGVRVMLEDGSYAVTDRDGRYHFEGVTPGTHVVQLDDTTLPADRAAADCARNIRSAGRAFSRFVDGRGGALMRVDFHAVESAPRAEAARRGVSRARAGQRRRRRRRRARLAGRPGAGHRLAVPRARAQSARAGGPGRDQASAGPEREAARRRPAGRSDRLRRRAQERRPAPSRSACGAASRSRAGRRMLTRRGAQRRRRAGGELTRAVTFSNAAMRAELLRDRSLLVADGVTRPVLAVRLTDRDGRPVRHGLTGDFEVPAPYYPAVEADAQQARQLAGLERARPFWRVEGEDGIAYIELEPTTASGTVSLRFTFRDGEADPRAAARSLARSGRAAVDDRRPRRRHARLQPAPGQHRGARRRRRRRCSPTAGSPSTPRAGSAATG